MQSCKKIFIGGLNWETTDQSLRDYFSQFREVIKCTVIRDSVTGRSRGLGFLTFKDPKTVNTVIVKEHFLDGKIIDPKQAIPRDKQEKTSKIFVGGDTGRPRGFRFVTFKSDAGVEAYLAANLKIHGKPIKVKKA
ncbi:RNA-binding domain-containing protein [Coniochaeta sp. PMI_546]|nr:RNA-binding domain-containing protein [Coniochaeta sp. PMI_546]